MAPTYTTGPLGLSKPAGADQQDISIINGNMDLIDQEFGRYNVVTPPASTAFCGAYPMGVSISPLTTATISSDPGWAVDSGATTAQIVTIRSNSDRAIQYWFRHTSGTPSGWYRSLTTTAYTPWRKFGDQDYCVLSGNTNINISDSVWTKVITGIATEGAYGYSVINSAGTIKINEAGNYAIEVCCTWTGTANTTAVTVGFGLNAESTGPNEYSRVNSPNPGGAAVVLNGYWTRQIAANDAVTLWVFQASGAVKGLTSRRIGVHRIGG